MADKVIPSAKEGETKQMSSDLNTYLKKVAMAESQGVAGVPSQTSSALGLFQFTKGTWDYVTKKMGVNWSLEDRTDPEKATKAAAVLTDINKKYFEKNTGEKATDTDLYMSAFLGPGGYVQFRKALKQDPDALAIKSVEQSQVESNKQVFYVGHNIQDPNDPKKKIFIPDRARTNQEVYNLMSKKLESINSRIASGKVPQTITDIDKIILPDQKVSVISPKIIDDEKNRENVKAKEQTALSTVVNTVNSVVVVQKNITQKVENVVDDSSDMSKKTKALTR
jgi:hypothetical protein